VLWILRFCSFIRHFCQLRRANKHSARSIESTQS